MPPERSADLPAAEDADAARLEMSFELLPPDAPRLLGRVGRHVAGEMQHRMDHPRGHRRMHPGIDKTGSRNVFGQVTEEAVHTCAGREHGAQSGHAVVQAGRARKQQHELRLGRVADIRPVANLEVRHDPAQFRLPQRVVAGAAGFADQDHAPMRPPCHAGP